MAQQRQRSNGILCCSHAPFHRYSHRVMEAETAQHLPRLDLKAVWVELTV
jgi:hypothetical protein